MNKSGFYRVTFETKDGNAITYHSMLIRADSAREAEKYARLEAMKHSTIIYNVFARFECK